MIFIFIVNEGDVCEYFFDVVDEVVCIVVGGVDFDEDDGCLVYIDEVKVEDFIVVVNFELVML